MRAAFIGQVPTESSSRLPCKLLLSRESREEGTKGKSFCCSFLFFWQLFTGTIRGMEVYADWPTSQARGCLRDEEVLMVFAQLYQETMLKMLISEST